MRSYQEEIGWSHENEWTTQGIELQETKNGILYLLFCTISTHIWDKNEHLLCTYLPPKYPSNDRYTTEEEWKDRTQLSMINLGEDNFCFGTLYSIGIKMIDFATSYLDGIRQLDVKQVITG